MVVVLSTKITNYNFAIYIIINNFLKLIKKSTFFHILWQECMRDGYGETTKSFAVKGRFQRQPKGPIFTPAQLSTFSKTTTDIKSF